MNQVQPALMPFWNGSGLDSENPAKLVRKQHAIRSEFPLPPTKMSDPLCLFQSHFILVQLVQCLLAARQVEGCDQGLEHFSPFSTGRGDFASRRRPVRRFFPY